MVNKDGLAFDIAAIAKSAQSFIKKVETGKGLESMGLPPDKIKEFKEKYKGSEAEQKIAQLKTELTQFKEKIKTANG